MKPERPSQLLLGITRSKAKMYEYGVPQGFHIDIKRDPINLIGLTLALLGDLTAKINSLHVPEKLEDQEGLKFSAYFFDSYCQTKLQQEFDPYLTLLGSVSYYLADLPGSANVLADRLGEESPDFGAQGLEGLLHWLIRGRFGKQLEETEGIYADYVLDIVPRIQTLVSSGDGAEDLIEAVDRLRVFAYANGSPRELLFADSIAALTRRRYWNSTWYCLPEYTDLSIAEWLPALSKDSFVRELWPAQKLIGEGGVFRGKSAIVQMPTSAGKTRANELIIRSAFLSERTELTVVVAPFRALCHEIRNSLIAAFSGETVTVDELSDVTQVDFDSESYTIGKQILVVTPEKLMYVLRHSPELAANIGLLIYDEGHQFDSGARGVTYELLLTSLKKMIPETAQTVLISAVISNAEAVGSWINGDAGVVISGTNLIPTYRTVAFTSWLDQLGRLEFINSSNPERGEFFVPRVIEQLSLKKKKGERKTRVFPTKDDGHSVALYLGLKLVQNGSVAIFCGKKTTAASLCDSVVEAYAREIALPLPRGVSDAEEIQRLHFLHSSNLGVDAGTTLAANLGVFAHHGNTPHGIRLSVEYAMKEGLARFVICTSTLAQGVNLPIRYLIVTSIYQGTDRIRVRDFHNLIGRVGRSGMHTEGSVLFADPSIYDKKAASKKEKWRWRQFKDLLEPKNSEPCASMLLSIFEPLENDDKKMQIIMEPLELVKLYVDKPEGLDSLISEICNEHAASKFSQKNLESQISWKLTIITTIESFLMAQWDETEMLNYEENASELVKGTLAYHLGDEKAKMQLIELFKLLAKNVAKHVTESEKRKVFGKTMYGVHDSMAIEKWTNENIEAIVACESPNELFEVIWPVIDKFVRNSSFQKCTSKEALKKFAQGWIRGESFSDLFSEFKKGGVKIGKRQVQIDHVVDLGENALGYDGMLIVGAVTVVCSLLRSQDDHTVKQLQRLQKRIKYGLKTTSAVVLYEMGFSDRVISSELNALLGNVINRRRATDAISEKYFEVGTALEKYPRYFQERLDGLQLF